MKAYGSSCYSLAPPVGPLDLVGPLDPVPLHRYIPCVLSLLFTGPGEAKEDTHKKKEGIPVQPD